MAFYIFLTIYSYLEGRCFMLTGYILPDTLSVFLLKYLSNNEIYMEAEVMITLKSFLFYRRSFTSPNMTSMLIVRS
jgi:hypothetical protein